MSKHVKVALSIIICCIITCIGFLTVEKIKFAKSAPPAVHTVRATHSHKASARLRATILHPAKKVLTGSGKDTTIKTAIKKVVSESPVLDKEATINTNYLSVRVNAEEKSKAESINPIIAKQSSVQKLHVRQVPKVAITTVGNSIKKSTVVARPHRGLNMPYKKELKPFKPLLQTIDNQDVITDEQFENFFMQYEDVRHMYHINNKRFTITTASNTRTIALQLRQHLEEAGYINVGFGVAKVFYKGFKIEPVGTSYVKITLGEFTSAVHYW